MNRIDRVEMKLELVQVPVSDVDRAKEFYVEKAGFHLDHDHKAGDDLRFVQLTPPGSAASIAIGSGLSKMKPGSVEGLQVVVSPTSRLLGRRSQRAAWRSRRSRTFPGVASYSSATQTATAGLFSRSFAPGSSVGVNHASSLASPAARKSRTRCNMTVAACSSCSAK
jgi:hypothetical protein